MILIALAVVALLLFKGSGSSTTVSGDGVSGAGITPLPSPAPAPSIAATPETSVIKNSTGGSLSAVLGSRQAPPSYYVSGNPGYDTQVKPVSTLRPIIRSGVPFKNVNQTLPVKPPVTAGRGAVNVPLKTPVNPAGTLKPIIANRPVVTQRFSPEVASAFWTRVRPTK
jgi:hypothetical protein